MTKEISPRDDSAEPCECGHEKEWHRSKFGFCYRKEDCVCKKFKPQNHSLGSRGFDTPASSLDPKNHNPPSSPHHNRGMLLGDEDKEPEFDKREGVQVSQTSGSDNQSRFQNHINVIKCATRLRDIDSTRHGSESLSEKIFWVECANDKHGRLRKTGTSVGTRKRLYVKDVKEFIKDLKGLYFVNADVISEIDKLAGKELTNG